MKLTYYNFIISFLWSNIFVVFFCLFRRNANFVRRFGLMPLMGLLFLSLARLFFTFEYPFTKIIHSDKFLPWLHKTLGTKSGFWFLTYGQILLAVWLLVSFIFLCKIIYSVYTLRRTLKCLKKADNSSAMELMSELSEEIGFAANYDVLVSPDVNVPAVAGFFSPTVLLPDIEIQATELKHVLRHEMYHFINHDAWIKLIIKFYKAICWWNPLIYLLEKNLDFLLELRCDSHATEGFTLPKRIEYVETVVELMKSAPVSKENNLHNSALFLAGGYAGGTMYERMDMVFEPNMLKQRLPLKLIAASLAIFLLSYCFVIQPDGGPPVDDIVGAFELTTENAYIVHTPDDSYKLYLDGVYIYDLTEEMLNYSDLNCLEIIEGA